MRVVATDCDDDVLALLDYTEEEMENLKEEGSTVTNPKSPNHETVTVSEADNANSDANCASGEELVKDIWHNDSLKHLFMSNNFFALYHRLLKTSASEAPLGNEPAIKEMIMTVIAESHVLRKTFMYLFIYLFSFLINPMSPYSRTNAYNMTRFVQT